MKHTKPTTPESDPLKVLLDVIKNNGKCTSSCFIISDSERATCGLYGTGCAHISRKERLAKAKARYREMV
jgi:hypothetical protein